MTDYIELIGKYIVTRDEETRTTSYRWTDNTGMVVRCKNCKYKSKATVNGKGFLICPASGMEITDDDYCSYGERRRTDDD